MAKSGTTQKAHATYSASGAERWLNCPGSIRASLNCPPAPDTKYSIEGTKAHECHELLLKAKLGLVSVKERCAVRDRFDEDMIQHAKDSVAWIMSNAKPHHEVLCEQKVDSSSFTCAGQFGTLDAAVVEPYGHLLVADYKYGAGIAVDLVSPSGQANPQLVYYALGLSSLYHHEFDTIELAVVQPRAYHPSGKTIRTHVMSISELLEWRAVFKEGVKRTLDKKAPRIPGKWCKFCPAFSGCKEARSTAMDNAGVQWSDKSGIVSLPEVRMAPVASLSTMLDACDQLEGWIAGVRSHAYRTLERGGEVPGYKLVPKRASRKWSDANDAAIKAQRLFGSKAFTPRKLLSPAQLSKKLGRLGEDFTASECVKESSGKTMVRSDDPRPTIDLTSVFSPV